MITEKAEVVALEGQYALVQTKRQSTCGQCSANNSCGTAVISKVVGQKYSRIRVLNSHAARVGDVVTIGLNEDGLLKSALLIYCLPLFAMFVSVAAAQYTMGAAFNEFWAVVSGFAGLCISYIVVKAVTARVSQTANYQPVMLNVEADNRAHGSGIFVP